MISSPQTIRRRFKIYGLTNEAFQQLFTAQEGCCAVCRKPFLNSRSIQVDHEHIAGWGKMGPEEKVRFVRGLLCFQDNYFRVAKNTAETIGAVYDYLVGRKEVSSSIRTWVDFVMGLDR